MAHDTEQFMCDQFDRDLDRYLTREDPQAEDHEPDHPPEPGREWPSDKRIPCYDCGSPVEWFMKPDNRAWTYRCRCCGSTPEQSTS